MDTLWDVRACIGALTFRHRAVNPTIPERLTSAAMGTITKEKWYQDGLCFECTQCGNCCSGDPGYIWATKAEIRRIAEFLGLDNGWLDKRRLRRVGFRYSLTENPNGDCIFLERNGKKPSCAIYPMRPLQCRTWPFWSQNLSSKRSWDDLRRTCPGTDQGKHYSLVQIESARTQKPR